MHVILGLLIKNRPTIMPIDLLNDSPLTFSNLLKVIIPKTCRWTHLILKNLVSDTSMLPRNNTKLNHGIWTPSSWILLLSYPGQGRLVVEVHFLCFLGVRLLEYWLHLLRLEPWRWKDLVLYVTQLILLNSLIRQIYLIHHFCGKFLLKFFMIISYISGLLK